MKRAPIPTPMATAIICPTLRVARMPLPEPTKPERDGFRRIGSRFELTTYNIPIHPLPQ